LLKFEAKDGWFVAQKISPKSWRTKITW
jgi:hypothetical protein